MEDKTLLGIDFGGSGIKGAPVDIEKGILVNERFRLETPEKSTPEQVLKVIREIIKHFKWKKAVGLAFPSLVQKGTIKNASNIDNSWIGINAEQYFSENTGLPFFVVNDADAAGIAEIKFGEGKGFDGSVVMLTIGTGIGTAMFTSGHLYPNTEIGHIIFKGHDAEFLVSDAARKRENLKWKHWTPRFNEFLIYIEKLLNPDMFIIGGGISKKEEKIRKHLTVSTPVKMAKLRNEAGIIGAAIFAKEHL